MILELTTTDLACRSTTSFAIEMSKMIPNLPKFHCRRSLPRSDLAEQTGECMFQTRHLIMTTQIICIFYF